VLAASIRTPARIDGRQPNLTRGRPDPESDPKGDGSDEDQGT
jgi:hypothetical protein